MNVVSRSRQSQFFSFVFDSTVDSEMYSRLEKYLSAQEYMISELEWKMETVDFVAVLPVVLPVVGCRIQKRYNRMWHQRNLRYYH
jgi:hypothetical protein